MQKDEGCYISSNQPEVIMWVLFNVARNLVLCDVSDVPASALNRLHHDFPWLEVRHILEVPMPA